MIFYNFSAYSVRKANSATDNDYSTLNRIAHMSKHSFLVSNFNQKEYFQMYELNDRKCYFIHYLMYN